MGIQVYMNKSFDVGEGVTISFDEELYKRTVLIYSEAIKHAIDIFFNLIMKNGKQVADFEVSIDETMTPTLPAQHFFVANELTRKGVRVSTVAPRFCGEFQKGIDYIGDLKQFAAEMKIHAAISRHFGYKISIHSGSDKFSIFPSAGRETKGRFHLKTAGTNWLEAMKLVAMKDPQLYREVHAYALTAFKAATAYYHVTTQLSRIPQSQEGWTQTHHLSLTMILPLHWVMSRNLSWTLRILSISHPQESVSFFPHIRS